ncbi:MAG TPA: di-heme oxidoredictase family protein [Acidimicrobiia bacterium]|nr:di-heme oxidoredictase family protein [Acidimicrobiia bacterium]
MTRRTRIAKLPVAGFAIALAIGACSGASFGDYGVGAAFPGGEGTVTNYGPGAFSQPAANLDAEHVARFRIGDAFFTEAWVPAGDSGDERDGLGPTYLASSCAACHPADGRSDAPATPGSASRPILRFAGGDEMVPRLDAYGFQLQSAAIEGVPAEAQLQVSWRELPGAYPDGTPYSLRAPIIDVDGEQFGSLDGLVATGVRVGPALIGLGLLEAIPESAIRALADPDDRDGDGVSGRVHVVTTLGGEVAIGRFGHKANIATIADQTAIAYLLDLGVTSPALPDENCPVPQAACAAAASGGSPEISASRFADVVVYASTLAVPGRPSAGDGGVTEGEATFTEIGCAVCHVARWETGEHPIDALANQTIYPYTDLLLHDMGSGLSDGRTDSLAGPSEWRTAPLWGLGLVRSVNANAGFLHDGRARTIEEAVLWHGGEGMASRDAFVALTAADRQRVIQFLSSL